MNADQLLELYDRVAESPNAIPRLRRFVLDLAVRGKLMEQDAADEPSSGLLKRIAKEKARLVKAGLVKAGKFTLGEVGPTNPAQFFAVPDSWCWTTLGDVLQLIKNGLNAKPSKFPGRFLVTRIETISNEAIDLDRVGFVDDLSTSLISQHLIKKGDILFSHINSEPHLGKTAICEEAHEYLIHGINLLLLRSHDGIEPSFLNIVIKSLRSSGYFVSISQRAVNQSSINQKNLARTSVPLPPLAEQHRIVAKVDELMALLDRLEQARAGRESLRDQLTAATLNRLTQTEPQDFQPAAHFALQTLSHLTTRPDQIKTLRQTILNLAVRGKLVTQDPTDEPAAELLKRIAEERAARLAGGRAQLINELEVVAEHEQDFDLPKEWIWTRLGTVIKLWNGFAFSSFDFKATGIPVIRIGDLSDGEVKLSSSVHVSSDVAASVSDEVWIPEDALLLAMSGATTGKTAFNRTGKKLLLNQRVGRIECFSMNINFIRFFFETIIARNLSISLGTAIPNLSTKQIYETAIPLPPLAEQHRIVASVDTLMALCDQLEASLTTATTTRSRLLEALLHEALDGAPSDQAEAAA